MTWYERHREQYPYTEPDAQGHDPRDIGIRACDEPCCNGTPQFPHRFCPGHECYREGCLEPRKRDGGPMGHLCEGCAEKSARDAAVMAAVEVMSRSTEGLDVYGETGEAD